MKKIALVIFFTFGSLYGGWDKPFDEAQQAINEYNIQALNDNYEAIVLMEDYEKADLLYLSLSKLKYHYKEPHTIPDRQYEIPKLLIKAGADVNYPHLIPLLIQFIRAEKYEAVKFLLDNGASKNSKDSQGHDVLYYLHPRLNRSANTELIKIRELFRTYKKTH